MTGLALSIYLSIRTHIFGITKYHLKVVINVHAVSCQDWSLSTCDIMIRTKVHIDDQPTVINDNNVVGIVKPSRVVRVLVWSSDFDKGLVYVANDSF